MVVVVAEAEAVAGAEELCSAKLGGRQPQRSRVKPKTEAVKVPPITPTPLVCSHTLLLT